ncbi:MAG TPA: hypothetical protein VFB54_05445 [Burkholderiales bacterium]|nr:hypothetical protein [Burkholderiales bacterium]
MTCNSALRVLAASAIVFATTFASSALAQTSKPYTEGSVWYMSMIRVKPGMMDVYMRDVLPLRKQMNEEAKKQGLILSSHVLVGSSAGRDDFDVLFLDEYKNWAAFDGMSAKYDAIASKVIGTEEKQVQLMSKRTDVREIMGEKMMQELMPK